VVSTTIFPFQSGRALPNASTAPNGMAMKMMSLASASVSVTARTVEPREAASSLIECGPRVLAMFTSTPALAKRRASAEPMFPLPTMA